MEALIVNSEIYDSLGFPFFNKSIYTPILEG